MFFDYLFQLYRHHGPVFVFRKGRKRSVLQDFSLREKAYSYFAAYIRNNILYHGFPRPHPQIGWDAGAVKLWFKSHPECCIDEKESLFALSGVGRKEERPEEVTKLYKKREKGFKREQIARGNKEDF